MNNNILNFISTYKNNKDILIIFKFGKYTETFGFDESLFNEKYYDNIYNLLESCTVWDEVIEEIDEKFCDITDNIVDTNIFKTNGPFDILLMACSKKNSRKYISEEYNETCVNYIRKYHTFSIKKEYDKLEYNYKFSLSLNSNKNTASCNYITDSSIFKIIDIFKACTNIDENINFTKINST